MRNAPQSDVVEYGSRRLLIIAGVMLATVLQVLDTTIVNVALPTMEGNLGANRDEGTWIITGYIIAAVIVIPLTPWLQTRFGRKQYYLAAILGFTLMSALCGAATSFQTEVVFRIMQGAFGGGLIATGQAILRDTFPPKDIGKSQVLVAIGAIVGPSIGPTLGGILTDNLSWNWVFYVNIVPGAIAGVLILLFLRNPAAPRSVPVDGFGLALLAVGLGSMQYVLTEGEQNDWLNDPTILGFTVFAVAGLVGFASWELYGARSPIVDLRILKNRTVAAGSLLAMTLGFSLFGSIVMTPQYNQTILRFTATLSGESILIRALFILVCTPLVLVFLNRFKINPRVLLITGFSLVAIACYLQSIVTTSNADFWTFWFPLALGGIGFSQLLAPLSVAVLSSVQGADTPKASSLLSLCQQLGGSISTAFLTTMLDRREAFHQTILAAHVTQPSVNLAGIARLVVREATTLAFADGFMILAFFTALFIPLVFLLRTKRAAPGPLHIAIE